MNVCIGDEVHARCSGRFHFELEWEKIMTNTLVVIKLHIFSHHTFYLSLKPLSDGVVYLGTVIQVDEIRKEVEIKELGPFILSRVTAISLAVLACGFPRISFRTEITV